MGKKAWHFKKFAMKTQKSLVFEKIKTINTNSSKIKKNFCIMCFLKKIYIKFLNLLIKYRGNSMSNAKSTNWVHEKTGISLVSQILLALVLGSLIGYFLPEYAVKFAFLGNFFISGLKAVAPILVFMLVASAIANKESGAQTAIKPVLFLYLVGTISAALLAVAVSFLFPTQLTLMETELSRSAPQGIIEVLRVTLFKVVDNPINALITGNFMGILAWALGLGWSIRFANEATKQIFKDLSDAITHIVRLIISIAPLGILGLVANVVGDTGLKVLGEYGQLLIVLVSVMVAVALVINPILVFLMTRENPFPLIFTALKESGITAFFTRSSAANVPVNLALCEKLNLDKETYSVSIPLGATINMAGAAVTISVLTLAAVHTLGIEVDFFTAVLLSVISALAASGASGVPGGSLLLIPLACSLFSIDNATAMQVIAIGFIIGVVQDSVETGLNSSTDVVFTGAACRYKEKKDAK